MKIKKIITCIISCLLFISCFNVYAEDTSENTIINRYCEFIRNSDGNDIEYNICFYDSFVRIDIYCYGICSVQYNDSIFKLYSAQTDNSTYVQSTKPYRSSYISNTQIRQQFGNSDGKNVVHYIIEFKKKDKYYNYSKDDIFILDDTLAFSCYGREDATSSKYVNKVYTQSQTVLTSFDSFGDINFDGSVDASDAQQILSFYVENLAQKDVGTLIDYVGCKQSIPRKDEIDSKFDFKTVCIEDCNIFAEQLYYYVSRYVYLIATGQALVEQVSDDGTKELVTYQETLSGIAGATIDIGGSSAILVQEKDYLDTNSDIVLTDSAYQYAASVKFQWYMSSVTRNETVNYSQIQVQFNSDGTVKGIAVVDKNNFIGTYPNKMTLGSYTGLSPKECWKAIEFSYSTEE